jgi:hypothetical protein
MKIIPLILIILLSHFSFATDLATGLDAHFEPQLIDQNGKGILLIGVEYATFNAPKGILSGAGFNIGYSHLLNSRLSLNGNISQGFNSKNFSFLYTQFGAFVSYAIFGDWQQPKDEVYWNGKPMVTVKNKKENIWGCHLGLDQYLFGGSSTVYNAPGASVGLYLKHTIWDSEMMTSLLYGSYTTSEEAINGIKLKFQFLLN